MPAYFNYGQSTTFQHYARPVPALSPWGTGAVNGVTDSNTGEVTFVSINSGLWRIHRTVNLNIKNIADLDVGGMDMRLLALEEADKVVGFIGGVAVRHTYERGTTTRLIPDKQLKQPSGENLTNPATQRFGGDAEATP